MHGIKNGSASLLDENGDLRAYYHCDYLGTTDYLTSAVNSKVISWTSYNEWGEITHNAVLKCGARELDLVKEYATHDYDAVLNQYYAKARFYDADNRRFTAKDPARDGFNWYAYVGNNPVNYIDPDGMLLRNISELAKEYGASVKWYSNGKEMSPQDYVLINNTLLMTVADIRMFNSKWNLSAEITLNGVTKSYTAANDSDDAALSFGRMNVMIDDLEFAHDWNYAYNSKIEAESSKLYTTAQGYIEGQGGDYIKDFKYGTATFGSVGCEVIAIYNALNKLDIHIPLSEIAGFYEHNPGMRWNGNGGTKSYKIDDFLDTIPELNYQTYTNLRIDSEIYRMNPLKYSYYGILSCEVEYKVPILDERINYIESLLTDENAIIITFWLKHVIYGIHTVMIEKTNGKLRIHNSYNYATESDALSNDTLSNYLSKDTSGLIRVYVLGK